MAGDGSAWPVFRVVERRPGVWFCEVLPSQWLGRLPFDPVRLVGGCDECLGLALHLAGDGGGSSVVVWPLAGAPVVVELSGVVPELVPGSLQAVEL